MDLLLYTPVDIIPATTVAIPGLTGTTAVVPTGKPRVLIDVIDVVDATTGASLPYENAPQDDGMTAANRLLVPRVAPGSAVNVICRRSITGNEDTAGPVAVRRGVGPTVGLVDGLEKDLQTAMRFMLRSPGTSYMDPDSGGGLLALLRSSSLTQQSAQVAVALACSRFNKWVSSSARTRGRSALSLERVRPLEVRSVSAQVARARYGAVGRSGPASTEPVIVVALQWKRAATSSAFDITTVSTV